MPAIAYTWPQNTIRRTGKQSEDARIYYAAMTRKGMAATLIYVSGIALSLGCWTFLTMPG